MSEGDLIRPHDPFSGHEEPPAADDTPEPAKPSEEQPPAPESTPAPKPKPAARRTVRKPAKKPVTRRGRRAASGGDQ
jgi:hypothetical protein